MGYNLLLSLCILMLRLSQIWSVGASSSWLLCPSFWLPHKMVQACSPSPRPGLSHFAKGFWFFLVGCDIRTQDLETGCAHCYQSAIADVLSVDRLGKIVISYHSCLSQFHICNSFLLLWEAWIPTRSIYLLNSTIHIILLQNCYTHTTINNKLTNPLSQI